MHSKYSIFEYMCSFPIVFNILIASIVFLLSLDIGNKKTLKTVSETIALAFNDKVRTKCTKSYENNVQYEMHK